MSMIQLPLPIVRDKLGNFWEAKWIGLGFMRMVSTNGLDRIFSFQHYLELYFDV